MGDQNWQNFKMFCNLAPTNFKPITFKLAPYISTCRRTTSLTFERKRSKVKAKVTKKVQNTFLAISRDSVELERFSWHRWIAELKAYTTDYEWPSKFQKRWNSLSIEHLTFKCQKMKMFIFNAISLKFCQKLLTVTQNKHTKFEKNPCNCSRVAAVSVFCHYISVFSEFK